MVQGRRLEQEQEQEQEQKQEHECSPDYITITNMYNQRQVVNILLNHPIKEP